MSTSWGNKMFELKTEWFGLTKQRFDQSAATLKVHCFFDIPGHQSGLGKSVKLNLSAASPH